MANPDPAEAKTYPSGTITGGGGGGRGEEGKQGEQPSLDIHQENLPKKINRMK